MNRSKRSMTAKTRKKMTKAVRNAQSGTPTLGNRTQIDELTAKELLKKYPKKVDKKKEGRLASIKKSIQAKKGKKSVSKRTTPGTVQTDTAPAYPHREGKRWIKTLKQQTKAARTIQARKGSGKK